MRGWKARLPLLAAGLWWGSLTAIGFLAVPLVFSTLSSPPQAGMVAAKLFTGQTWMSLCCGLLLLMTSRTGDEPPSMDWGSGALVYVLAGMLLALLQEFAIAPHIVLRQDLAFWHAMGTGAYAAQWLCALVVLWKLAGLSGGPGSPTPRG
jgi:hypothetical protein